VSASTNLDLVRSIYAAFERGDFSSVEWAHSEIELVIADGPDPSVSTGLVGMLEGGSTILDAWEDWRPEVEEYRELDGERVLVLTRRLARQNEPRAGVVPRSQPHSRRGREGNPDRALLGPRLRARRPRPGARLGGSSLLAYGRSLR